MDKENNKITDKPRDGAVCKHCQQPIDFAGQLCPQRKLYGTCEPAASPSSSGAQYDALLSEAVKHKSNPPDIGRLAVDCYKAGEAEYSSKASAQSEFISSLETKPVIYTVHLPKSKHIMTQDKLNNFLNSDKAMLYQDCQIKITMERVK